MNTIDDTHSVHLHSWVNTAEDPATPFPIQNLPFGRFRHTGQGAWSTGVAIGDQVLDLRATGLCDHPDMASLLASAPAQRQRLRRALSEGLRSGSTERGAWQKALLPQAEIELGTPCEVRNYTDFFIGIHHAARSGALYRPEQPLLPNYRWLPIGYHGRASTVRASGHGFSRPRGQVLATGACAPHLQPSAMLDYELELGIVIGQGNAFGEPISIAHAEQHVFGLTLLNDWSARDIQRWEAQPLGPFLAKSFATTVSPWIVTTEALAPFRRPFKRPEGDPQPLPYLDSADNARRGAIDVHLEVWLQTERMRASGHAGDCICRSNFADAAYWTMAQLVTHHSANGCELLSGDLLGTGTLSGASPDTAACLLEATSGGRQALDLSNGEKRTYLLDGDEITLRGHCDRPGHRRIGFGDCRARVLA